MVNYKERFEKIARDNIERAGIEQLLTFLENSDFYKAPASTRFHDSEEEGLVKHSIRVFERLDMLNTNLGLGYSQETIAIVSLFHDICKVHFYKTEMRNTKNEQGKWVQVPYYTVEDKFPLGHGEKSLIMLMGYLDLDYDEILAIRWHMGGFVSKDEYMTLNEAMKQSELVIHLNYADMMASYVK